MRDLQAREHLHCRLTGRQETTPVAIMTSAAKGNHGRVLGLLAAHSWFGRGRESFRQGPLPCSRACVPLHTHSKHVSLLAKHSPVWLMQV